MKPDKKFHLPDFAGATLCGIRLRRGLLISMFWNGATCLRCRTILRTAYSQVVECACPAYGGISPECLMKKCSCVCHPKGQLK